MAADSEYPGLDGVADAAASISGSLTGLGLQVTDVDGQQVSSETAALAVGIWFAYLNEAANMLEQRYATRDDIDAAMRFGCGYPTGPLAQLDQIGLGKAVALLEVLHEASRDPRHVPSSALTSRVANGETGQAAGVGFYRYAAAGSAEAVDSAAVKQPIGEFRQVSGVGVVGTGTMATGIVEVFAKAGFPVTFVARSEEKVQRVKAALEKSLGRAVDKGRMAATDRDAVLARVTGSTEVSSLAQVDLVVEAIVEELAPKQQLFKDLDSVCKSGAILATTTSSLSVAAIAAATSRPADVIGMHFFNPAPIMKLVEIVITDTTAPAVTDTVVDLCAKTKKVAVLCGDRAGFIVNFLLFPYLNDVVRALDSGLVNPEGFDKAIKEWQRIPLGPFALLDVVGNDVSLAIEETIATAFGDPCYRPAVGLQKVVAAGKLGRKSGAGFFDYGS